MITVKPATAEMSPVLSELAYNSEAYWNYDSKYMNQFRQFYNVNEAFIKTNPVFVLETDGHTVGFFGLRQNGNEWELEFFYIAVQFIGRGSGRLLWNALLQKCRELHIDRFGFVTSPQAAGFYEKMGAKVIGKTESLLKHGRMIPKLEYILTEESMTFEACYSRSPAILMEGALGERLKREYGMPFDPHVAMAGLVYGSESRTALTNIWSEYIHTAEKYSLPFIATTPTRRANRERVSASRFDEHIMDDNIQFLRQIQKATKTEMYIGALMGCKGDAYQATDVLTVEKAREFHSWQADLSAKAGTDFLFAGIMPALPEAIGMAKAMEATGLPYIISFMIRKNGRLIDGTSIHDAIQAIDRETQKNPICYMSNCVHPLVLKEALCQPFNQTELVQARFHGLQANTSPLSPEELDNCADLITSASVDLAEQMMELNRHISMKIYGGCCGTDKSHMEEIAKRIAQS